MAIFNVNGKQTDDFGEAFDFVREVYAASKAEAVEGQRRDALSKPTPLDRARQEAGVEPDMARKIPALDGE